MYIVKNDIYIYIYHKWGFASTPNSLPYDGPYLQLGDV